MTVVEKENVRSRWGWRWGGFRSFLPEVHVYRKGRVVTGFETGEGRWEESWSEVGTSDR